MSLFDTAKDDAQDILEDKEGFSVPVLFTSPPPDNTEFGTLDPEDLDNQIRAFPGDHYTQYNPETGVPQAALNSKATLTIKTLLNEGIIDSAINPNFENWKIAWLDITSGVRRDFLINRIHPTLSLFHIVLILGEIEITP